jgi:hypothetical protein
MLKFNSTELLTDYNHQRSINRFLSIKTDCYRMKAKFLNVNGIIQQEERLQMRDEDEDKGLQGISKFLVVSEKVFECLGQFL